MVVRHHSSSTQSQTTDKCVGATEGVNVDEEAKQWNGYVDTLKSTCDAMYEICLARQNVLGCEEALMYLTNAVRDFQSLIASINIELEWENSENRTHSIAWEVKGATYGKALSPREGNTELSSIAHQQKDSSENCLKCRTKRRISSDPNEDENSKKTADVYERLAYGKRSNVNRPVVHAGDLSYVECQESEELHKNGCVSGRLMTPRSAMDIPQTKSSMAKIAASRQLLWQRHKKILTEKLNTRRRQEQTMASLGNRRRSLPTLVKQSNCAKTTAELNLESIRETHEEDRNEMENSSTKTHAGHFTTRSDGFPLDLLDMNNDDEWQALTEEEESLAQEEESLKREIEEEESISIDEELQRRVTLDFGEVNVDSDQLRHSWQSVVNEWTVDTDEDEVMRDVATETPKPNDQDCLRFRRPGQAAQVHQRLLSPIKRRNLDTEEILERQNKAEELRRMLQEQKAQRLQLLLSKVEEVRIKREELMEKKRLHLENKMRTVTESRQLNRQRNIEEIVKKAKDNDQKLLEVSFINQMGAETIRLDVQLRDQAEKQRLLGLEEERARTTRDRALKEAAAEERRRIAEQQRDESRREQATKDQERHLLAETKRTEALELPRKIGRLKWEQKVEDLKTNELVEAENLRLRIQEKLERGARRHEELKENARQRAIDTSTPRPMNPWTSLADCSAPPSDLRYSAMGCGYCKKCAICKYTATSDLDLIGHLMSSEHLSARETTTNSVCFTYLKNELENCVQVSEELQPFVVEEAQPTAPLNKKLRSKIKQKLAAANLPLEQNFGTLPATTRQSIDKKSRELRNLLQHHHSSKIGEHQRTQIERAVNDLRRLFLAQTLDNRPAFAASVHQIGLLGFLIDFITQTSIDTFDCSPKALSRLICKNAHFLMEILEASSEICCLVQFSAHLFPLLEWIGSQTQLVLSPDNKSQRQSMDEVIAALGMLHSMLVGSCRFMRSSERVSESFLSQFAERLHSVASYWANFGGFLPLHRHFIIHPIDPIKIGFDLVVRPINLLSSLVCTLIHGLQNNEKSERSESQILNLYMAVVECLVVEIYAKIRSDPVINALESGGVISSCMTSSLISSSSSSWLANANVEVECASLLHLWNSLNCPDFASNASTKQRITDSIVAHLSGEMAIRFVYILIVSIHNGGKTLPTVSAGNKEDILTLPMVLNAVTYFAGLSPQHQVLCTLGWQKSLLMHVCKLPFEFYQEPNIRSRLLTSLVVILFENREGVLLSRDHISPSWMAEFLKELLSPASQSQHDHKRVDRVFSEQKWRCALEFFESFRT